MTFNTESLTSVQLNNVLKITEDIISNLNPYALNELLSGTGNDVDTLMGVIFSETKEALFNPTTTISASSFDYLENFSNQFDWELKKRSFNYFVMSVMPDFDISPHHIEWGNFIHFFKWLTILAARDHSKSFTFSFAYPIWKIFSYDRHDYTQHSQFSKKGMIITNEYSLAKTFLKGIKEEIENNPFLKEYIYPSGQNVSWGNEELTTKNGANLQIKGSGSQIRGRHPHWIVVDDFLSEECIHNSEMSDSYIEFFHSTIMNALVPNGQIIVVGTPMRTDDLYQKLKEQKGWRVFEYPSIYPDGRLLWPNRYTFSQLMDKKDNSGSVVFNREQLVRPINAEGSIFPWDILNRAFIGMQTITIVDNINSFPKKMKRVALGCDFAISGSVNADSSCFTVMGIDEQDNYWLIYQFSGQGLHYTAQIGHIKRIKNAFNPDIIFAEDNAFQQVMIQMCKDNGIQVVGHTTGKNKHDLKTGLPGLATVFEQGRMRFPRGDQRSKDITDKICVQASGITWDPSKGPQSTTKHDDELMSLS